MGEFCSYLPETAEEENDDDDEEEEDCSMTLNTYRRPPYPPLSR
jgi:hypothetical protein